MKITTIRLRKCHSLKRRATLTAACVLMCIALLYFWYIAHVKKFIRSMNNLDRYELLRCNKKDFEPRREIRGDFWVFENYVRAEHNHIDCYATVTFTTQATIEYLEHLETLVVRWRAPVSVAIHAPGTDFQIAVKSIVYLRNCLVHSYLIRQLVTFHIFFPYKHFSINLTNPEEYLKEYHDDVVCSEMPPYDINPKLTYMQKNRLLYPIDVGRNVARDAAMTHFVLSSDIDFYPSPNVPQKFLKMIERNTWPLNDRSFYPRVFPLALFQMEKDVTLPVTKLELKTYLVDKSMSILNNRKGVHNIPDISSWLATEESEQTSVVPPNDKWLRRKLWNPIFIGTHRDPHFDGRLSWEGENDKTSQAYIMCIENYTFMILSDMFLVHSYNQKPYSRLINRGLISQQQSNFFEYIVSPQLKKIYGTDSHCML